MNFNSKTEQYYYNCYKLICQDTINDRNFYDLNNQVFANNEEKFIFL